MTILFSPIGVYPVSQPESAEVGGLLDKVHNLSDILALLRNGTIADALAVIRDLKNRDLESLKRDGPKILADLGFPADAAAVVKLIADIENKDWLALTTDALAEIQSLIEQFGKPTPATDDTHIRVMLAGAPQDLKSMTTAQAKRVMLAGAPQDLKSMTTAQAKRWLADNRANVREGSQRFIVKKLFRNHPEVLKGMDGTLTAADVQGINPDTLARIMQVVEWAIPILTAVSAFVPYLIPVVIFLKFIDARYRANHPNQPELGVTADPEHGLGFEDMV